MLEEATLHPCYHYFFWDYKSQLKLVHHPIKFLCSCLSSIGQPPVTLLFVLNYLVPVWLEKHFQYVGHFSWWECFWTVSEVRPFQSLENLVGGIVRPQISRNRLLSSFIEWVGVSWIVIFLSYTFTSISNPPPKTLIKWPFWVAWEAFWEKALSLDNVLRRGISIVTLGGGLIDPLLPLLWKDSHTLEFAFHLISVSWVVPILSKALC